VDCTNDSYFFRLSLCPVNSWRSRFFCVMKSRTTPRHQDTNDDGVRFLCGSFAVPVLRVVAVVSSGVAAVMV
jgi:hypothetical protein